MKQSFPPIRRHILLTVLAAILVLAPLLVLASPLTVGFASQAIHQSHLNYFLFTPLLTAILLGLIYRYLAPVARLGHLLRQEKEPPLETICQARQVALNAPAYIFVTLLTVTVLITFLSNLVGLLFIPGYPFALHLSQALLTVASATGIALILTLIARRQLQPVILTTTRLIPSPDTSPPSPGKERRFDIRTRILILVLALSFIAYYFPSILAINLAYQFRAESEQLIRHTLFLLLGFGLVILVLTLLSALVVATDVADELRQVTRRLLEAAQREEVGEQLHVLSLDEIGDLVRAFNEVQARMQAQQVMLQQEHQRLLVLQAVSSRISAIFDLDRLLDELVQSVSTTFGYYNAVIFLADEREEELHIAATGRPLAPEVRERHFKIGAEELVGRVASTGTPLLIPDVSQCDFCTASSPQVRSEMSIPMLVGGQLVGVFDVESDQTDGFEERDLQLMTALTNQAAAAIEAVRLLQESRANAMALERRAHNLMLINRVSTTLNSSLDAYEILHVTVQHLAEFSGADYGSVLILERDGQHARVIAEHPARQSTDLRLSLPRLPQHVLELGIPYEIKDASHHPLLEPLQKQNPLLEFHSLLLVPLVARREMIGILLLASLDQPRTFSDEEMDICQTVASQAAVAVANARLLQDVQQSRHALTRKSQELTEESSKLDAILNNIADGLVVTDPAGRIILSNPAFRGMTSLPSARSPYGRLLAESFPVAGLQPLVTQALESPAQVFTENLELPDSRVLKASATALRIPPPILEPEQGEQIAGVVTVLRDITHEVEVDRMKTDFISAVSHELRSPLTAILGFVSLIQQDLNRWIMPHMDADKKALQIADRILENLDIVEDASRRLTRLIDDMLDIAKIEAGRMEWDMNSIALTEVIQSAVLATTPLADEKHLPIQVCLPPDGLPPIWGHRDRLIQVMTNLLSNSIKFTKRGHVQVSARRVWVSADGTIESDTLNLNPETLSPGEWVVVSVTDTGIGVPAKEITRIFEKFTQVGDTLTEKPEGTGLGLSICKGIVEHHGGQLWAESEPGQGSSFSFVLPAMPLQEKVPEGTR